MNRLVGLIAFLLLVGAGCTPNAVKNTSVAPKVCGSDKVCGEEILRECQPGTYIADKPEMNYTIEGIKNNTCSITMEMVLEETHPLKKELEGKDFSMTCALPLDIDTYEDIFTLADFNLESDLPLCSGILKDFFKDMIPSDQERKDLKAKQISTPEGRDKQRIADLENIRIELQLFKYKHNRYPEGTNVILGADSAACLNASGWQPKNCADPYKATVPSDPVKTYYYSYTVNKKTNSFTVTAKFEGTIGGAKRAIVTPDGLTEQK